MMDDHGTSTGWTPASAHGWFPVFTTLTVKRVMVIDRVTLEQETGRDEDATGSAMPDPPHAVTSTPIAQIAPIRSHITRVGRNG
jgi:hypothetical protein